ncbi:MAG: hypothetical protein NC301_09440 [Bacteroides sp.]|nr:hypothetical protein [Bacteroides sp.]MCM1380127.1 hypothetical protein [Bacteroides sp.]MCM1446455.1 hypothetical protein [Prevotella sp.]
MKQKTKKRLRTLAVPVMCVWVLASALLVSVGSLVKTLGLLMVAPEQAKDELTDTFDNKQ